MREAEKQNVPNSKKGLNIKDLAQSAVDISDSYHFIAGRDFGDINVFGRCVVCD
jgi:hypothetical protein